MDSEILQYFPQRIASALAEVSGGDIREIRLRTGRGRKENCKYETKGELEQ